MQDIVYTVKDLAEILNFSETVVRRYIEERKLKRIPNIASVRVTRTELLRFMQDEDVKPLSPFERKRFELEIENKDKEIEWLRNLLNSVFGHTSEYVQYMNRKIEF